MTSVSNISLQLMSIANLNTEETNLGTLNEQLATGVQHDNLTDYDPTTAHNIMSFQNAITQKQAYIAGMTTVSSRLSLYDTTMTDMESIASQASTLASSNQSQDAATVPQLQAQVQAYMKQLTDDMNQQTGGRYIYAGSRYSTTPVIDLSTLTGTPAWPFVPVTQSDTNNLPDYDSQYNPPTTVSNNAAYTQDSVQVNTAFSVQYGVTSTAPAFQQMIAGLQFMNAATQTGVPAATYQTDMQHAASLLQTALSGIQTLHTTVASNTTLLKNETDQQNTDITNLTDQLTNVQQVNVTQVGVEIQTLQSQLQASYSATASLEQLSILKYL